MNRCAACLEFNGPAVPWRSSKRNGHTRRLRVRHAFAGPDNAKSPRHPRRRPSIARRHITMTGRS